MGKVIAIIAAAIPTAVFLWKFLVWLSRRISSRGWEVGDKIILDRAHTSSSLYEAVEKSGEMATLVGWNSKHVFYTVGGTTYREDWLSIKTNKSDNWRKSYSESRSFMGKDPGFNPSVSGKLFTDTEGGNDEVEFFGKRIELMSEIECEVNLKLALEQERYELAEKIRERLNGKFR